MAVLDALLTSMSTLASNQSAPWRESEGGRGERGEGGERGRGREGEGEEIERGAWRKRGGRERGGGGGREGRDNNTLSIFKSA